MADVLIRGIDSRSLKRLKERAKRNGRSLQGEAKRILERASGEKPADVKEIFARWKGRLAGRRLVPTTDLLREDRGR